MSIETSCSVHLKNYSLNLEKFSKCSVYPAKSEKWKNCANNICKQHLPLKSEKDLKSCKQLICCKLYDLPPHPFNISPEDDPFTQCILRTILPQDRESAIGNRYGEGGYFLDKKANEKMFYEVNELAQEILFTLKQTLRNSTKGFCNSTWGKWICYSVPPAAMLALTFTGKTIYQCTKRNP